MGLELTFWGALAIVAYAYFGYPLLLMAWRAVGRRPVHKDLSFTPAISVILPVHNEGAQVLRRLESLLGADYPSDRIEVVVVSDGSTDDTPRVLEEAAEGESRLRVVTVPQRRGKGNALNEGIAAARADLLVFVDAGIELDPLSLRAIVAPFADRTVGCVSGEDQVRDGGGEGLYGRYEMWLRRLESEVSSIVGASGSFYAQRRELCPRFPEGLAPDFLSVLHAVEGGTRAVSEPAARGWMRAVARPSDEYRRKVRTLVRGMTALSARRRLLWPSVGGGYAVVLWSHKMMRWAVPWCLVLAFVANLLLLSHPLYQRLLAAHVAAYAVAGVGILWPGASKLSRIAGYFVLANAAVLVAWLQFLSGTRVEVWAPSKRS